MISPPSDIILDVSRAADPARLQAAATRLAAAAGPDGDFAATLANAGDTPASPPATSSGGPDPTKVPGAPVVVPAPAAKPAATAPAAYRDFEAMVLGQLFQSVLPQDDTMFGTGTAGNVWKGVFIQELGKAVAAKGGIGIAAALARNASLHPGAGSAAALASAPSSTSVLATIASDTAASVTTLNDALWGDK